MKTLLLIALTGLTFVAGAVSADLPTVSIEHLYYLKSRAERIEKFQPEQMIDYCIAQKLGSSAFDSLYMQVFTMRTDMTKLLKVQEVPTTDPRVMDLKKTIESFAALLQEEARRVQNGIVREGEVAKDALAAIAKAQAQ